VRRFYKHATAGQAEAGWQVLLDGKPMRTPAGAGLVLPTEALARAIAAEWDAVPDKAEIKTGRLPLTRLGATGTDRVTSQRSRVIADTAKYAGSDLLCYRATDPVSLVERQQTLWQPWLDWAADRYGARLVVTSGTSFADQPPSATAPLADAVARHSDLALAALYNLTHIAGSVVLALAVSERALDAAGAYAAAELDALYQIERWGEDPTAQARLDGVRTDIAATALFLELLGSARLIPRETP